MLDDTIAAVATPPGRGGIAVIRVSGRDAIDICDGIFRGGEKLGAAKTHTVHYGHITDGKNDIDEVLVTVMRAPRTYTREDVVEISTHGGYTASKSVMHLLIKAGARPAEAGEFTKRAFLNGRIDLSQAEGVIDIINSKTEPERKNALFQAEGGLSRDINKVRSNLVHLAARMQVAIDYPDEDLDDITPEDICEELRKNSAVIKRLINTSDSGRILREGVKTAIVGKPNVGKSSLLNCLAREDRAIVTEIAGTTRDVIEETVNVGGVLLRLSDTAGIRETEDTVEKMGIERSKRAVSEAELIMLVLDSSREIDDEDRALIELTEGKKRIIICNKTDIASSDKYDAVRISAKTGDGMENLCREIKRVCIPEELTGDDSAIVTNMRHLSALELGYAALSNALKSMEMLMPQDMAALDINEAIDALGRITGDTVSEDIVSEIFHNFCVGK